MCRPKRAARSSWVIFFAGRWDEMISANTKETSARKSDFIHQLYTLCSGPEYVGTWPLYGNDSTSRVIAAGNDRWRQQLFTDLQGVGTGQRHSFGYLTAGKQCDRLERDAPELLDAVLGRATCDGQQIGERVSLTWDAVGWATQLPAHDPTVPKGADPKPSEYTGVVATYRDPGTAQGWTAAPTYLMCVAELPMPPGGPPTSRDDRQAYAQAYNRGRCPGS